MSQDIIKLMCANDVYYRTIRSVSIQDCLRYATVIRCLSGLYGSSFPVPEFVARSNPAEVPLVYHLNHELLLYPPALISNLVNACEIR